MGQRKSSHYSRISEHISKVLRQQFDDVPREPLPERWVDLINYLNAQEREQAKERPPAKRAPPLASAANGSALPCERSISDRRSV